MKRVAFAAAALALVAGLATGCGGKGSGEAGGGSTASGEVGVVLPFLTSPFWQAYNHYVPQQAAAQGVDALPTVNSDSDPSKQIRDIQNLLTRDVKGLVVSPLDSGAIGGGLNAAARKGVPVIAVDVAPDKGKVAMVVRADNRAYGEKACRRLGQAVKTGKVVQIQGDLASINGRDRSESFTECIRKNYPDIRILNVAASWQADKAATGLEALYTANPDVKGIYMQAGGVYLAPTLQTLKRHNALVPVGNPRHIVIVSNDGILQELDAIRRGEIDATVSQPADLYAKYGMYYIKRAMEGETFKVGPTDHNSTIVRLPSGSLEDELPAPLVTRENVDDKNLWGNRVG
ncbi:ABC transporter substrate-binding protein [Streptomyces mirabilis]|jgi:ABC-type sugar transport system substrate-binding protein|uniref:sugar ABC transporter substrate-binding protein n=1 Tax=Streptomyces TaxID=1883 RepID=UPI00167D04AC|nr:MULTISPECIES: sugar ABC transporter substrate-binding protein [Streptomyces]GHD74088.1 ABC transporter substrate-binding protein [Streptomyces mirabilis]